MPQVEMQTIFDLGSLLALGNVIIACLIIAAGVRFVTSIPTDGWTRSFGKALWRILLAGIIAYALPYCLEVSSLPEGLNTIPRTIYAIMQTISIQAPVDDTVGILCRMLPHHSEPAIATYAFLLNLLAVVIPFVVVSSAIGSFKSHLQHLRFISYRRDHKVAYVFWDLSDIHVALARDILRHREEAAQPTVGRRFHTMPKAERNNRLRPLLIFCGVTDQVHSDNSDLIQSLRDKGKGDVCFTQNSITELVDELIKFDGVHCFAFTENRAHNVEDASELISTIGRTAALRARTAAGSFDAQEAKRLAFKFSVYCTHDNRDDELVFDSLGEQTQTSLDDLPFWPKSDQEFQSFQTAVHEARKHVEVRLISLAQERIYDALTKHPLFEVLDPVRLHGNMPKQDLWVIVLGLGQNGVMAIETAYWMSRLHNVAPHILGIDVNAPAIVTELESTHPEMMAEKDDKGQPIVQIRQAQVFTPELDALLSELPQNARVYAMVTLGDDQLNLNAALRLRRLFDDLILEGKLDDPGKQHRPMVLPLICANKTYEAAECMTSDRREPFDITPFGCNRFVFSFNSMIVSPWEQYALAMAAAYMEMFGASANDDTLLRGTQTHVRYADAVKDYSSFEIKKLSNRTCVRHIPYRLWSLGIDPTRHFDENGRFHQNGLTNSDWFKRLGITIEQGNNLLRQMNVYAGQEVTAKRLAELRNEFPMVCALADLEHERWMAFYRSQGWRDLTIEDCQKLVDMGIIAKLSTHQSPKLRRHCYLCNIDTLVERGVALQDDPFVYDRAAIVETQRILTGSIFEEGER